jgi:hypothetical protein
MEDTLRGCDVRAETAYEREQREKLQAQTQQVNYGDTCGKASPADHPHAFSMRHQAEKQVGYHREQADRNDRAAAFFRENPAFDEFIQLVRQGIIQF